MSEDLDFGFFDQIKNKFQNLKENDEKLFRDNSNLKKENQTLEEKFQIENLKLIYFSIILENKNKHSKR
jgi:hypothetical protein